MVFALSKILWVLASPPGLSLLILVVGSVMGLSAERRIAKKGARLCLFVACFFLAVSFLPVGDWALTPLENRFAFDPPDDVTGIIVLGGDERPDVSRLRGMPTALDSMRRFMTFMDMARRYPDATLLFSGGSSYGRHTGMQEADVARAVITDIGVPAGRLRVEQTSRNTYENAVFSADMLHPDPSQKWLLVTSAWHMPRAMACFRKAGWNVYAAPTGYFTRGDFNSRFNPDFVQQMMKLTMAVHEYVGLAAYRVMGRTDALWPE